MCMLDVILGSLAVGLLLLLLELVNRKLTSCCRDIRRLRKDLYSLKGRLHAHENVIDGLVTNKMSAIRHLGVEKNDEEKKILDVWELFSSKLNPMLSKMLMGRSTSDKGRIKKLREFASGKGLIGSVLPLAGTEMGQALAAKVGLTPQHIKIAVNLQGILNGVFHEIDNGREIDLLGMANDPELISALTGTLQPNEGQGGSVPSSSPSTSF